MPAGVFGQRGEQPQAVGVGARDLLRADRGAREAYAADKRRITAGISGSLEYAHARTQLIQRLLGN